MVPRISIQKFHVLLPILCLFVAGCSVLPGSGRPPAPFSLIVLPDTQIYPHDRPDWRGSSRKEVFVQQTTWIRDNAQSLNIQFVLHMGDIVHDPTKPYQWANADEAMRVLDGVVPYAFALGNHDMINHTENGVQVLRDSTIYNRTFPYTRYEKQTWFGGRMKNDGFPPQDNYDNSYHFFEAGGLEFMVLSLEVGPTDEMLAWANEVVASHPKKRTIVITHSYLEGNGVRVTDDPYLPSGPRNVGERVWEQLVRKHRNIFLVLCGHHNNLPDHRGLLASTGDHGNTVYQLINGEWYDGWLRILRFVPAENTIQVKTYSPWRPKKGEAQWQEYGFPLPGYNDDMYHEYEFSYDMTN